MDAALAAVIVGALALIGTLGGIVMHRLSELEKRVAKAEGYNRRLWAYTRRLVDQYYRWRQDGAPDPDPLPEEDDD